MRCQASSRLGHGVTSLAAHGAGSWFRMRAQVVLGPDRPSIIARTGMRLAEQSGFSQSQDRAFHRLPDCHLLHRVRTRLGSDKWARPPKGLGQEARDVAREPPEELWLSRLCSFPGSLSASPVESSVLRRSFLGLRGNATCRKRRVMAIGSKTISRCKGRPVRAVPPGPFQVPYNTLAVG